LGHGLMPARFRILIRPVRRFVLGLMAGFETNSRSFGACRCQNSNSRRSSENRGVQRVSRPSCPFVLRRFTRILPFVQSMSAHRNKQTSEGTVNPPYRARANIARQWASGQAARTRAAASKSTNRIRDLGLAPTIRCFMSSKGFLAMIPRRKAHRWVWLQRRSRSSEPSPTFRQDSMNQN